MEKSAIMFLDYNDTFDDISDGKGHVFFCALRRFSSFFNNNVKIVVITSAINSFDESFSIQSDLSYTISNFPNDLKQNFQYLVEGNNQHISEILQKKESASFGQPKLLSKIKKTKREGVEAVLRMLDPTHKISTCVFAGNSEANDAVMMDSEVDGRQKYLVFANTSALKSQRSPVYYVPVHAGIFNYGQDIIEKFKHPPEELVFKTTKGSYGLGKGLEAVTCLLQEKEKTT